MEGLWNLLQYLFQNKTVELLIIAAICILLIFISARFIKSFVYGVLFVLLLGGLLFVLKTAAPQTFDWIPQVKEVPSIKDLAVLPNETANNLVETKVKPMLQEEIQQAKVSHEQDGSYVITTPHLTLRGNLSEGNVSISYLDHKPFTVNDSSIRPLIEPLLQQGQVSP